MSMVWTDSDDDDNVVKEASTKEDQQKQPSTRLQKKRKIQVGPMKSAQEDATGTPNATGIQSVPWPPLDPELEFYRKPEVVQKLHAAGVLRFLSATSVQFEVRHHDVLQFVENYQSTNRVGIVRGRQLELTADMVSKALRLPNQGVPCCSLKQEDYPIGECFSTPAPFTAMGEESEHSRRVPKAELTEEWREIVGFVQRWLVLDVDPHGVDFGVVVAAFAVFQRGVLINWPRVIARRLHEMISEVKLATIDSEKTFCAGYYLTKIFDATTRIVATVKAGARPKEIPLGTTATPVALPMEPVYCPRLGEESSILAAHESISENYALLKHEHGVLQLQLEKLKVQAVARERKYANLHSCALRV